jgi:fructose-1,6-bisphosphatase I
MINPGVTLPQFLAGQSQEHGGEFSALLTQIASASKIVSKELRRSKLAHLSGLTGDVNVQGEAVTKLDQFTNSIFVQALKESHLVGHIASEEMEEVVRIGGEDSTRKYSVLLDPLDGSSNADINGIVGTIFSVHRHLEGMGHGTSQEEKILKKGSDQVAAGYVIYGPGTVLVFSAGEGVNGFTLHPELDEFIFSHQDIRMPDRGNTYAINYGNRAYWFSSTEKLVDHFSQEDESTGRPYSQRWVGSLTADFHRILLEGGLYVYPRDQKRPDGKLRLLYECAPLAFIARQAGGTASTGMEDILDIEPNQLHQRVPLIIGSREDVETAERFYRDEEVGEETTKGN